LFSEIKILDEDPVSCKKTIWRKPKTRRMKGIIKCKVKNKLNVGCLTEKLPHIHNTKEV
jgi:hypothetical protein